MSRRGEWSRFRIALDVQAIPRLIGESSLRGELPRLAQGGADLMAGMHNSFEERDYADRKQDQCSILRTSGTFGKCLTHGDSS